MRQMGLFKMRGSIKAIKNEEERETKGKGGGRWVQIIEKGRRRRRRGG